MSDIREALEEALDGLRAAAGVVRGRHEDIYEGLQWRIEKVEVALAGNGWREGPDYIFDAENWDTTYAWGDRSELADIVSAEGDYEPWRFETLRKGPPVWAKNVVLTRDEYGDPDETEVRWFKSEEEARACQPCPQPPAKDK